MQISEMNAGYGCPYCANKRIGYGNDLKSQNPKLAKQWHPTKNGDLKPSNVFSHSGKKVWWICKEKHEWEAAIYHRSNNRGCPYCSGHRAG